ncbi:MAG: RluA family pseudouridine synthase [Acidobacteria bacterium]|jgi:23S rRNA pseudouridine1911/1915/1917 synthase|nr:RluA family pseudouridine synthase [Acidobacteriota bacterium]
MADSAPFYRNMDRYFIRLKKGERLALGAVLQKHLRATPGQAEQLLRQGSVWDSERKVRLRDGGMEIAGQLLRVDRPKFQISEYELAAGDIKFEDEHLLVVYKRGGLAVQPTPYSDIDNLLHGVQKYYDGRSVRYKAAPVNRLDLPAQGLVFFAKDRKSDIALNRLFQEHRVRKRYLAATSAFAGVQPSYVIRSALEWLGRSKEALTYVRFCRERQGRFFFLVFPQSGRTHQIRRHFQEQVAPLLGDVRYGGAASGSELWLLCFQYAFPHPFGGRTVRVRYLPAAWQEALGAEGAE